MNKDILLIILALVSLGLLATVVGVFEKENKVNKSLEEERYIRMVAEEGLQKNAAKLATLEVQLKEANQKMLKVQDLINQEKFANAGLKKQYEDLNKTKSDLEAKLKNTLEEKTSLPAAEPVAITGHLEPATAQQ